MKNILKQKFNSIDFPGLNEIKCGDAMHYCLNPVNPNDLNMGKSIIRLFISLISTHCKINSDDDGKILFYFSATYKERKSFYQWFLKVCNVTPNKIIVSCRERMFYINNIFKLHYFFKWMNLCKEWIPDRRERWYYLSILFQVASEYWTLKRKLKDIRKIRLCVTVCDVHAIDSIVTQYFNNKGIDTASLQHGVISRRTDPWMITGSKSKYYLVYGDYTIKQGVLAGVSKEKMLGLGMPHYIGEKLPDKIQNVDKDEFGVIFTGVHYQDEDISILKIADKFARENGVRYKVKLHPGDSCQSYAEGLDSDYISGIYSSEISIEEFREQISFAIVGKSTVFFEYCLKLTPIFLYQGRGEDDFFEEIDWCKFSDDKELVSLYNFLKENTVCFEVNLKQTREYICEKGNIADNYRGFFNRYII